MGYAIRMIRTFALALAACALVPMAAAAATGPVGDPFQLTDIGATAGGQGAAGPALAYNPARHEFFMAFNGGDRVRGQRFAADGAQLGANDFVVSAVPPATDFDYDGSVHPYSS